MRVRLLLALLSLTAIGSAEMQPPLLYHSLALGGDQVVFSWSGRLWTVPRTGGTAHLLLPKVEEEQAYPLFSPDGRTLAFTLGSGTDSNIWVCDKDGKDLRQFTFHQGRETPRAWSPDSRTLLFGASRRWGSVELYERELNSVVDRPIPAMSGYFGCYSPDGKNLAYVPRALTSGPPPRRFYRGGSISPVTLLNLRTLVVKPIGDSAASSILPMWNRFGLYALTDTLGSFNLVQLDPATGKAHGLTNYRTKGITWASIFQDGIAYIRDGQIHLFRIADKTDRELPVSISEADLKGIDERGVRTVSLQRYLSQADLSADGKTLVLEARGDVWLIPLDGANPKRVGDSSAAERSPALSMDGDRLAFFSDGSGEYSLMVRDLHNGRITEIKIPERGGFYQETLWSPDGARIAFSDNKLGLWVADLPSKKVKRIALSEHLAQGLYHPTWSHKGRFLVYSMALPTRVRTLFAWDSQSSDTIQLTDGCVQSEYPSFDRSGKYLYYSASPNAHIASASDIGWALQSDLFLQSMVVKHLMILPLQLGFGLAGPFSENAGADRIDELGITTRGRSLGFKANIDDVRSAAAGQVLIHTTSFGDTPGLLDTDGNLYRVDLNKGRAPVALKKGIGGIAVSQDGSTLLCFAGRAVLVAPAAVTENEFAASKPVDLSTLQTPIDTTSEWKQIYDEAWRMMRDYFYDPHHHGQDVPALRAHYAAFLPAIVRRQDLNSLLVQAFGEISISHLRVSGGDAPQPSSAPKRTGALGAEFTIVDGRYRITRIMRGAFPFVEMPDLRSPLDQPGVRAEVGDFILKINDEVVTDSVDIDSLLVGTAGKPTNLTLAKTADGEGAWTTTVVPTADQSIVSTMDWAERNKELVDKLSGGKLAYVYVPGWQDVGYDLIYSSLSEAQGKQGLIIDERFNGGGVTSDMVIEALVGKPLLAYEYRNGNDFFVPDLRLNGPKVLLINEGNGSAAETFALMFRTANVGTEVGMATYGAGIGSALFQQQLVDGGRIAIPNRAGYNPVSGEWEMENRGVQPDIRVDIQPKDYAAGRDPQLETAVRVALSKLPGAKNFVPKRPKPPIHPK